MYPKKPKELISEYAKQVDISEEDAADMVNGFYRAIRTKASELEHWNIGIRGIGFLRASYKKTTETFYSLLQQKTDYKNDKRSTIYMDAVKRLPGIIKLLRIFKEEWKKEKVIRNKKTIYANNKKDKLNELERDSKGSVGKQGTDS